MEKAKRMVDHWFMQRKVFKCVTSQGTTYDYHLIEHDVVIAQVSFHPNGVLARWARCARHQPVPHGKVFFWDTTGALTRVCDYVLGKRHGLDVYYKDGLMVGAMTYLRGRKNGLAWGGDSVALYRHGEAVIPPWSQPRLTYLATYGLTDSLRQMLLVGAVDTGEALGAAAYEGHVTTVDLLLSHQSYEQVEILEAWKQALQNGQTETLHRLRPHLSVDTLALSHALWKGQLTEATELVGRGFYPTEGHLIAAATKGALETVRWCLVYAPDLRTHTAWSRALMAEHYEVARLLEPGYVRFLRAVRDYFVW